MSLTDLNTGKYGVTQKKWETLDSLNIKVLNEEGNVEQLQAIVTSLTEKLNKLTTELKNAEQVKKQALSNKELGEEVFSKIKELEETSSRANTSISEAKDKAEFTAVQAKVVVDKLIYSAKVINKLANLVVRKKALNPLISDELVAMVTKAGSDANTAVPLLLKALESVYASQATILESRETLSLEEIQVKELYKYLTTDPKGSENNNEFKKSVRSLLDLGYKSSEQTYNSTLKALNDTTAQLSAAQRMLSKATTELSSLKSGYAAAKAAALAS
mgnify:CR=1 FL=1